MCCHANWAKIPLYRRFQSQGWSQPFPKYVSTITSSKLCFEWMTNLVKEKNKWVKMHSSQQNKYRSRSREKDRPRGWEPGASSQFNPGMGGNTLGERRERKAKVKRLSPKEPPVPGQGSMTTEDARYGAVWGMKRLPPTRLRGENISGR